MHSTSIRNSNVSSVPAVANSTSSPRGQAAVEVLVYVGFFLLVFVILNLFFVLQISQDITHRQYELAQNTAGQVSDDMQLAITAGPGFNSSFQLPATINGHRYVAEFYNTSMYITVDSSPIAGVSDSQAYATRIYFPLGTRNIVVKCLPTATGCFGTEPKYDTNGFLSAYRKYDFTAAGGFIRIQNELDSDGQPQLQILPVDT